MVTAAVVDGDGVVRPRHVRLKTVEPGLAKDGVETVKGGDVESLVVGVGGEGEALPGEEERAGLGGTVGEVDGVGGDLGGGGDGVTLEVGGIDEVAVAAGVDEEVGGAVVDEAAEDEEVGAGGMKVEVGGGERGRGE